MDTNGHGRIKIEITEDEINRRIDQIEALAIEDDLRDFLINTLRALVELDRLIGLKQTTIWRLRKMFNKQTERSSPQRPSSDGGGDGKKPKKGNGGRNGKEDYPGANVCKHCHNLHKEGDICPECGKGKLLEYTPGVYIKITGNPVLKATVHETQKLRCSACLVILEADYEGKGGPKYDARAKAAIALLKYGASFPFYRLEKLQKQLHVPMPASTQWDLMEELGDVVQYVWHELLRVAADGQLYRYDDTSGKILSLIKENKSGDTKRKGMYTTGIMADVGEHRLILFMTGRKYAGENMDTLLAKRDPESRLPMAMSDASANNNLDASVLKGLCLSHGRRNFLELEKKFQEEVDYVIGIIAAIYHNDSHCRDNRFDDIKRLEYHRQESGPLVEKLHDWCEDVFDKRKVEENSSLGKSIKYLQNHWDGLTSFLRIPGMPLDNNLMEQKIKTPVINRKNWYFYKTELGALIGDMITSVLKTAEEAKVNPFEYLVWIQENAEEVKESPQNFMPWKMPDVPIQSQQKECVPSG